MTSATAPRLAAPPSDFQLQDGRRVLVRPILPGGQSVEVFSVAGGALDGLAEVERLNHS